MLADPVPLPHIDWSKYVHQKKFHPNPKKIRGPPSDLKISPKIQRISKIYKGEIFTVVFLICMVLKDICIEFYTPSLACYVHRLL
jgi:hypothetical protein